MTGVVRAWYDEKGFGFIAPDHGGQDVFIHRKQLGDVQTLIQGSRVQFDLAMSSSSGKPAASRLTLLGSDGAPTPSPAPAASASAASAAIASMSMTTGKGFGKGGAEPSDNLFICGLPLDMTEDKLRNVFNEYGSVTTMRLLPDVAGKPDKSALVRMSDVGQAAWMVENLHGNIPKGLPGPITVRFADNRAQKARELGLPKPGTPGAQAYGAAGRATMAMINRISPYGDAAAGGAAADPAAAAAAAAVDPAAQANSAALLLAALAQIQVQQGAASAGGLDASQLLAAALPMAAAAQAPTPGQTLQELLQDLQNLQGLSEAAAAGDGGLNFLPS